MKKVRVMALVLCAGMMLSACGTQTASNSEKQEAAPETSAEQEKPEKEVMMVYMVGSNLESEAGMASMDITEMMESNFDTENMEVLVCTGGASYWWIDGIKNDECTIYEVSSDSLNPVYTLNNENMAQPETLTEFVNYSYMNYDAGYYSLVLWDHGGGAILGYGADENYDYDTLSMTQMNQALKGTKLVADGNKFEWIGFDACLMGMIEVADMMSDYSNFLIASEEVEAGEGWDYTCLGTISDGAHFDGASTANEIISAYSHYYENNYNYAPDYTLACLDLSQTAAVVESLDNFVTAAETELQNGGYSKIARQRDQTKSFGKISSTSFYDTVDLYDLAVKMMLLYPEESSAMQSALDNMVVSETSNVLNAHGVAVYFPYDNKEYASEWMETYSEIGFSEEYTSFLRSFSDTLSGAQLADWNIQETVPAASEETTGSYFVQLSENQLANYGHSKYGIWEEDSEGTYICWLLSSDVSLSEDGELSTAFDGNLFYLGDDSGYQQSCCATEIEGGEGYSKFAIPCMVNQGTELAMEPAYIHVKVDEEHPEGVIIGVYHSMDTDSTLFPDKDVMEIKEGDTIYPFYFARDIIFNEDGSVAPFEEWKASSGIGDGFSVQGSLNITMKNPEDNLEYCCMFSVTDTQGNTYDTNPIYLEL